MHRLRTGKGRGRLTSGVREGAYLPLPHALPLLALVAIANTNQSDASVRTAIPSRLPLPSAHEGSRGRVVLRRVPAPLGAALPLAAQRAQGGSRSERRGGREGKEGQGEAEEVRMRVLSSARPIADWSVTDCE